MWAKLKRLVWDSRGVWFTAPSLAGVVILLRFAGLLESWEWDVFDQYMRWRPSEQTDQRIVIVGIDEEDLRYVGKPIIPDQFYVKLLKKLKVRQPRAIGLDIYRDLPVQPGHRELVELFSSTPNLVGIEKVVGDSKRETIGPPPALKVKGQVGANDLVFDADKRVRRGLLFVADQNGKNIPSFSLYLAGLYLEPEGIEFKKDQETGNWQLGQAIFKRFESNDGGYVKADAGGYQILLNYRGPSRHFETVSLRDILEDKVPPDWGNDCIILIGAVGESSEDLFFTPYTTSPDQLIAGVEIHANITSQLISAAKGGRPLLKTWSETVELLWIFGWSWVGAFLAWKWRYAGGAKGFSSRGVISLFITTGGLLSGTYVAFCAGWWIPVVPPLLALTGSAITITTYIANTAGRIRKTFGRYLTDEVVANLLESPEGLKLGGHRQTLTILTSDLRGFTAISEQLAAEEVIEILNLYLAEMAEVITSYQGTIDEFMGDGILVLFGAPTIREDDAVRAVACAVAMQLAMVNVNKKMREKNLSNLEMGIGIHTGEAVVGNIGSEKRSKYGVVGAQVNLTYRIESYTIGGQILISENTLASAGEVVKFKGKKQVQPKGVQRTINIYDVEGVGGKYNLFLPQEKEKFFPLPQAIQIQYMLLDGKHVGDTIFRGSIIQLSAKGAELKCSKEMDEQFLPSELSNIKLNLLSQVHEEAKEDVYAKVLSKRANNLSFFIYFTSKPRAVAAVLDAVYESLI
ncbi:MAG: adenylate/guanylate cyclase domain-containing protein [Coleofasciculaceae cyanobacterium]